MRPDLKEQLLILEAQRWVDAKVREVGGSNKGELVTLFQRAVDKVAAGEPWCMAFVQFCVRRADDQLKVIDADHVRSNLFASEHCMTTLRKMPKAQVSMKPEVGSIVIWEHGATGAGHTGIVKEVRGNKMITIEGNTGAGSGVVREGDGVYQRERLVAGEGSMHVRGFIKPWA